MKQADNHLHLIPHCVTIKNTSDAWFITGRFKGNKKIQWGLDVPKQIDYSVIRKKYFPFYAYWGESISHEKQLIFYIITLTVESQYVFISNLRGENLFQPEFYKNGKQTDCSQFRGKTL